MQDEAFQYGASRVAGGVCVKLLEGNSRTTIQYMPYGAQEVEATSPFDHTIDNEDSLSTVSFYLCDAAAIMVNGAHLTQSNRFVPFILQTGRNRLDSFKPNISRGRFGLQQSAWHSAAASAATANLAGANEAVAQHSAGAAFGTAARVQQRASQPQKQQHRMQRQCSSQHDIRPSSVAASAVVECSSERSSRMQQQAQLQQMQQYRMGSSINHLASVAASAATSIERRLLWHQSNGIGSAVNQTASTAA